MKIVINSWEDDYLTSETMEIDGKEFLSVYPLSECPEDAIIGRDLISCSDVADFMEKAFNAGKNGEKWELEVINKDPDKE